MLSQFFNTVKKLAKRNPDRIIYQKEFLDFLHAQAKVMHRPLALLAMVVWLGFAFNTDPKLHPEFPELLYFRLGLSVVGLVVFVITYFDKIRGKGQGLLHILLSYSLFSCAFFTGRLAHDANYVSGLQILIIITTFLPARLTITYQYYIISAILFITSILIYQPNLSTADAHYSINNLIIAYLLGFIMGFILDRYRFGIFVNQFKISQANTELQYEITERRRIEEELRIYQDHLEELVAVRTSELRQARDEQEQRVIERTSELAEANRRLQQLDRMKSDFLSSVSHELRTPLTSILGFAKLIRKDFDKHFAPLAQGHQKEERKALMIEQNLEVIVREGERLTRLINDVLDLSKIESGRIEWHDEVLDMAELVEQTVRAVSGEFADRPEVKLKVTVEPQAPEVRGDRDRLVQVMINLVNNASKFTKQGLVSIHLAGGSRGGVRVEVADTGQGIPLEDLDKVFDQFYQVIHGDTLGEKPRGTGLGLSICREIVEHYGGRIWVESELGAGSHFIFVLPPATTNG